jgi:hypothetical protein
VPLKLQWIHSLLLKVSKNAPYRPTTLEWLSQSDNLARFLTREFLEGFWVMNQQSSSTMRVHQAELTVLIWRSNRGEIRQKSNLVQNLAQKRYPIKESPQRGFDAGCKDHE